MSDVQRLSINVHTLVTGWREHIQYGVRINGHVEARAKSIRYEALLAQLQRASHTPVSSVNNGGSSNKPGSRPPGSLAPLHLLDEIHEQAWYHHDHLRLLRTGVEPSPVHKTKMAQMLSNLVETSLAVVDEYPQEVHNAALTSSRWVYKARILLGYDKPQALLRDTVCGQCGGTLSVASDASTDVRCVGTWEEPTCGMVYPRWQWLDLLGASA